MHHQLYIILLMNFLSGSYASYKAFHNTDQNILSEKEFHNVLTEKMFGPSTKSSQTIVTNSSQTIVTNSLNKKSICPNTNVVCETSDTVALKKTLGSLQPDILALTKYHTIQNDSITKKK